MNPERDALVRLALAARDTASASLQAFVSQDGIESLGARVLGVVMDGHEVPRGDRAGHDHGRGEIEIEGRQLVADRDVAPLRRALPGRRHASPPKPAGWNLRMRKRCRPTTAPSASVYEVSHVTK